MWNRKEAPEENLFEVYFNGILGTHIRGTKNQVCFNVVGVKFELFSVQFAVMLYSRCFLPGGESWVSRWFGVKVSWL